MSSDYQKQIKEIFGTDDLDKLRELAKMLKINHPNPRLRNSSACRARPYISISITPSISARTRISPCG